MAEVLGKVGNLTWIELKLFLREPLSLAFVFAYPLIVIVVLGGFFRDAPVEVGPLAGFDMMESYVPAYIGLVIASVGLLGLPVHLAGYRELGVLRRFRASGLPPWALFGSQGAVTLAMAVAGGAVLVVTGMAAFDTGLPQSVAGVAAAFMLTVFCFTAIGTLLGAVMPNARSTLGFGLILWFVMMMLSGTDGPLPAMPGWLQTVAEALPLTHAVRALQYPWVGLGWYWEENLVLLGAGAVAWLLAARVIRWE
ncbi:MAG: ABC transporter permease [Gaiellales bacterium]|nr:MAG: ABC transporter permease [Gaiellales bacterium]